MVNYIKLADEFQATYEEFQFETFCHAKKLTPREKNGLLDELLNRIEKEIIGG